MPFVLKCCNMLIIHLKEFPLVRRCRGREFRKVRHPTEYGPYSNCQGLCCEDFASLHTGLSKNEDQMDFMDENNLIKRLCSQMSIPQIVWVIINISDKMDKLYFTRDTLQEVTNCIQSIEKSKDPNVLMTKMRKDLPIHVKRMICQEVSDIYYKIMLI
ncbi:hypothetical protein E2320_022693 [Naja naja]|nr:hypothetical protein E2320_022693 [Naja naja]